VPQETHPAFDYTALEIVLMGRYPHLGAFEVEGPRDLTIARAALETTGTAHLAARLFDTLSGGEKQRVVIASALAQLSRADAAGDGFRVNPNALLLLDEPTASLDLRYQLDVAAVLARLRDQGLTIVLSTHDLRLAASLSTSVVLLGRGAVLGSGAPRDALTAGAIAALYEIGADVAAPLVPA
jgi:iron complex transport system ATP-binding protein